MEEPTTELPLPPQFTSATHKSNGAGATGFVPTNPGAPDCPSAIASATGHKQLSAKVIIGGCVGAFVFMSLVGAAVGSPEKKPQVATAITTTTSAAKPSETTTTKPPKTTTTTVFTQSDRAIGSRSSCGKFRSAMGDAAIGILTYGELRKELKTVDDKSIIATLRVQIASTQLLAAVTSIDNSAVEAAALEMSAACTEAGW